jgi:hypothetical protein
MCIKERLGGELWWTLNFAIHGVGGVLMSLFRCMEWSYERILKAVWESFQVMPNLK